MKKLLSVLSPPVRSHCSRCSLLSARPLARYFSAASPDVPSSPTPASPSPTPADHQSLSYISYESKNDDRSAKSPILLHHCLFGRKENWVKTGKALLHLTKRRVVIPDARNHGNSFTSRSMSLKLMSEDLAKLLHQLDISRASLVGHGHLGGRIAMMTALTRPDLVDKMIVASATPLNSDVLMKEYERMRQACYVLKTLSSNTSADPVTFKLEADSALRVVLPQDQERALFLNSLDVVNHSAVLDNPDLGRFPSLEGCSFSRPVLFVKGSLCENSWSSDFDIRQIRQIFPNSTFHQIPGTRSLKNHEDFLETIVTFLESENNSEASAEDDAITDDIKDDNK